MREKAGSAAAPVIKFTNWRREISGAYGDSWGANGGERQTGSSATASPIRPRCAGEDARFDRFPSFLCILLQRLGADSRVKISETRVLGKYKKFDKGIGKIYDTDARPRVSRGCNRRQLYRRREAAQPQPAKRHNPGRTARTAV